METRNRAGAIRIVLLSVPSEWGTVRQGRSVSLPYRVVLAVADEDNGSREIMNPIPSSRVGAIMWRSKRMRRQNPNPSHVLADGTESRQEKTIPAALRCHANELLGQ
jgi:hypothetical protein